jgi:hypothetical protein
MDIAERDRIWKRIAELSAEKSAGSGEESGNKGETGPQGPQGETGPRGEAGRNGRDGKDGMDGAQGATGPQGEPGKDGEIAEIDLSGYVQKTEIFRDGDETLNIEIAQETKASLTNTNSNILIGAKPSNANATNTIGIGFNTNPGLNNIVIGNNIAGYSSVLGNSVIIGNKVNPSNHINTVSIVGPNIENVDLGPLNIQWNTENESLLFRVGTINWYLTKY